LIVRGLDAGCLIVGPVQGAALVRGVGIVIAASTVSADDVTDPGSVRWPPRSLSTSGPNG
jgi:hypothetical protein